MENSPNNQPKRANGLLTAGLVVMTAVAGFLGYLLTQEKEVSGRQESDIQLKVQELATTHAKLDSISLQLDQKIAEVQRLGGNVDELMKVKADLERDKAALRKNSRVSIAKYDAKIKEYEAFLAQKDEEIAKLQEENQQLTATNETLNTENTGLKTNLETTRKAYTDTVSTISAQNRDLTEKVTIASALKAENVRVYAITPKGKERDGERYKAKKVDKIKVAFQLAKNPLTKEEPKDILVRLVDPEGAVVSDMATGSGTFNTKDGKEMVYTTKQQVTYSNNGPSVEVVYARGGQPYKKGRYNVELYSEGFKIGEGGFEVR
jgi:cell division protein FtsB